MNFLVDAQLPPALSRWISSKGHQANHLFDLALHTASDSVIWERARNENAAIITKDEDFVDRWLLSKQPAAIIWVRKGNCSNRALLEWLDPLWPEVIKRLEQGERLVELRS